MKLSARDAGAYFRKPDPDAAGCLIYGEDTVRVGQFRAGLVSALLGPDADEEMRLTRLTAAELRGRTTRSFSMRSRRWGSSPAPRAVQVDQATDGFDADIRGGAVGLAAGRRADHRDRRGVLAKKSSLRKLFEGAKSAYVAAVYDDPPGRAEIEELLQGAGVSNVDRAAMTDLETLARTLSAGDFRQTIDKLGLYKRGDATPVSPRISRPWHP